MHEIGKVLLILGSGVCVFAAWDYFFPQCAYTPTGPEKSRRFWMTCGAFVAAMTGLWILYH